MNRLISLLLMSLMPLLAMADGVTPEQALEQAQSFIQKRETEGIRPRRAPGKPVELTPARQVNGLYVFNIDQNDGFVIVSNDDRTTPILGYSDKGNLDPDNMPDNLRAWLQGYADEIAWMNEHTSAADVPAKASLRTPKPVMAPIAPLLTTTWDQIEPYNNLCPMYDETHRSATGCVATAMAQVMYYNERRVGNKTTQTTAEIPSYTSGKIGIEMPAIPAGSTIDWENMIDDYSGEYTEEQAQAVATLMLYCGTAVGMIYGQSSSANSFHVIKALNNYFDYENSMQLRVRCSYSYDQWVEMLYHEFQQGRPVYYSACSDGGNHAFVCDGYGGEDYFHMNWGWSGNCDGFFKLTALLLYEQGTGGSSSNEGFNRNHSMIVGIQKKGETGTVLNLAEKDFKLKLNAISVNHPTIQVNQTVEVTCSITNEGTEDYSGTINFYFHEFDDMVGQNCFIAAGETKDVVKAYTPTQTGVVNIYAYTEEQNSYYYPLSKDINTILLVMPADPATDQVQLTFNDPVIENAEFYSNYKNLYNCYKLFGPEFKGTLRISNETDKNYSGYLIWLLQSPKDSRPQQSCPLNVPAGGYVDLPVFFDNLDNTQDYFFFTCYSYNGELTDWKANGLFWDYPAIVTYTADGKMTVTQPEKDVTVYDAATNAPNAVVVNIEGTKITEIIPNASPNTLYVYGGDTKPSGLEGKNIVKTDKVNYTAENISLTDHSPFYTPFDLTTDQIEFNYQFTTGANGTKGWNTLTLPFDVISVTADGTPIDWFHSDADTDKDFWVKSFAAEEKDKVYFEYADQMKANTPYLVAFPSEMSNQTIQFVGSSTTIPKTGKTISVTGISYIYTGCIFPDETPSVYCLNKEGNAFELSSTGGCESFHAYFLPRQLDKSVTSLGIESYDTETTGIESIQNSQLIIHNDVWYDLSGRKILNGNLSKGIYIQNGKKIVK